MSKASIKKSVISNPNMYIKGYKGYLAYSALNSFSLKYYFLLLVKQAYSIRKRNIFKKNFKEYLSGRRFTQMTKISLIKNSQFQRVAKDKFFTSTVDNQKALQIKLTFVSELVGETSLTRQSAGWLVNDQVCQYTVMNYVWFTQVRLAQELFGLLFFLNITHNYNYYSALQKAILK